MPQMYTDKRGTHLFGNEPIRFEDGGSIELELDDDQIEEYKKGGYIIEDISVPSLTKMQGGGDKLIKGLTQPTKIIRDINTIGKELLGELLQGPSNRKAIAAGNNWLDNWISHPVTQKMKQMFLMLRLTLKLILIISQRIVLQFMVIGQLLIMTNIFMLYS